MQTLLYALMLPSGNDAAVALAQHFGNTVAPGKCDGSESGEENGANSGIGSASAAYSERSTRAFVQRMNERAAELGLSKPHYMNPHGVCVMRARTASLALQHVLTHPCGLDARKGPLEQRPRLRIAGCNTVGLRAG